MSFATFVVRIPRVTIMDDVVGFYGLQHCAMAGWQPATRTEQ